MTVWTRTVWLRFCALWGFIVPCRAAARPSSGPVVKSNASIQRSSISADGFTEDPHRPTIFLEEPPRCDFAASARASKNVGRDISGHVSSKERGTAEDATDLSAKYRGCTGLPISVYGLEGGCGRSPLQRGRVGCSITSGCRAYVFRVVPLKSCSHPWGGSAGTLGPLCRRRTCFAPAERRAVEGGASERWVLEGSRQAPGDGGAGTPPPRSPVVVASQRSEAQRCAAERGATGRDAGRAGPAGARARSRTVCR